MAWETAACRLLGAMGQVKDVVESSAPQMAEQRFVEQVGMGALPVPEASASPWFRPHLVES